MKWLLNIFFVTFFVFSHTFAQYNEWSETENVTDSLYDYQNASLLFDNYYSDNCFITYEKIVNDSTTHIMFGNFTTEGSDTLLLAAEGVHFTHSQIILCDLSEEIGLNSFFSIFFETNEYGNKDIYYIIYYENDSLSAPIPFINSTTDEYSIHFSWPSDNFAWQSGDTLLYGFSFNINFRSIIDIGNCSNPLILNNSVYWLKIENDNSKIFFRERNYQTGEWSEPAIFRGENNICEMNFNNFNGGEYKYISWTEKQDSISQLFFIEEYHSESIRTIDTFMNQNKKSLTCINYPVILGKQLENLPIIAFLVDTLGYYALYANNESYGVNDLFELSSPNTENRNCRLFITEQTGFITTINVFWECFQNGHWQIMTKEISFYHHDIDDVNELYNSNFQLSQNYPNPFNPATTIKYKLVHKGDVTLKIYNTLGEEITTLVNSSKPAGNYNVVWDGKNHDGIPVSSGIYFYILKVNNYSESRKMILLR